MSVCFYLNLVLAVFNLYAYTENRKWYNLAVGALCTVAALTFLL
jgi:hypothetical protein